MSVTYDAVLVLSFGGPEGMDDVMPFLEHVTRGRNTPAQRLVEVAHHYELFGGVSPINQQNRELIDALKAELHAHGPDLPVFWGNRNWHPFIKDTLRDMADRGVRRAVAFVTSAFGSYSSCRQYLDDIEQARAAVGADAPIVDKLRIFYNHPGFIEPMIQRLGQALAKVPPQRRAGARLVFTAHSIPESMAKGSDYESQLREACGLVAAAFADHEWDLVYQSRSGPPSVPWLGPDVCDHLRALHGQGAADVVLVPIGFVSDHMEVVYDLDVEARAVCDDLGLNMVRAQTVGTHRRFVTMIRQLITERMTGGADRPALGRQGPGPDVCPADCCPRPGARR